MLLSKARKYQTFQWSYLVSNSKTLAVLCRGTRCVKVQECETGCFCEQHTRLANHLRVNKLVEGEKKKRLDLSERVYNVKRLCQSCTGLVSGCLEEERERYRGGKSTSSFTP